MPTKDPYAIESQSGHDDDDDNWGLDAFAERVRRNSSIDAKQTYQGSKRGRVEGMEVGKKETTTKASKEFSASTLAFGRELADCSPKDAASLSKTQRAKAWKKLPTTSKKQSTRSLKSPMWKDGAWSVAHLPVVTINEDSDDDECFLCKYRLEER